MLYFVWYDDNAKKPLSDKLEEAIAAYIARFNIQPSVLLVNVADLLETTKLQVRVERTVQPNSFWLGYEDAVEQPST
jgi:hypothetical protein